MALAAFMAVFAIAIVGISFHSENSSADTEYTFTVQYDAQGGSPTPPPTIMKSTSYPSMAVAVPLDIRQGGTNAPTKSGYTFAGWGTTSTATPDQYVITTMVSVNSTKTLYAIWAAFGPQNIQFNANGGSGNVDNQTINAGVSFNLPSTGFTRSGYFQSGWSTSASGGTQYTMGQSYKVTAPTTFYAIWTSLPSAYFDTNAPSTAIVGQTWSYTPYMNSSSTPYYFYKELYIASSATLHITNPPTGFNFNLNYSGLAFSWTPNNPGVYLINFNLDGPNIESSLKQITAVYFLVTVYPTTTTPTTYTVSFDPNGAPGFTVQNSPGIMPNNAFLLWGNDTFSRPGYTMVGWQTTVNGAQAVFLLGQYFTVTGDTAFKAYWIANPNIVVFNANGADSGTISPYIAYTDGQITLPTSGLTKAGYTLAGWYLQTDTSAIYPLGYIYTIGNNVTFYAYWISTSATTVKLTINSNGGTGDYTQTLESGKKAVLPIAGIQKSGGLLAGFDTTNINPSTPAYLPGKTITVNSTMTLYASWLDNSTQAYFTVSFNLAGGSGSITPQHVLAGGKVTKPTPNPTKDASIFNSWYSDNTKWDFATMTVASDMTLYATYDSHFTLSQNNLTVKLTINSLFAGATTIDWGDGHASTVTGNVANYTYNSPMSGTITVTSTTFDGTVSSTSPFVISDGSGGGDGGGGGTENNNHNLKLAIMILVVFVLLVFIYFGYLVGGGFSIIVTVPLSILILAILYYWWYL